MTADRKFDVKGVIFDLGSTLIEYETIPWDHLHLLSLQEGYNFLQEKRYPIPSREQFERKFEEVRDRYRARARESLKEWVITDAISDLLHAVGLDGGPQLARDFFSVYYRLQSDGLVMFDDVLATLQSLRDRRFRIGMVSNTIYPAEYHLRELKRFDILKYFDFTIFSSEFGYRKPHPSIYEKAVALSGYPASELLFIGDRYLEDVEGPAAAGLHSILRFCEGREYPQPLPDKIVVINSLSELLSHLKD